MEAPAEGTLKIIIYIDLCLLMDFFRLIGRRSGRLGFFIFCQVHNITLPHFRGTDPSADSPFVIRAVVLTFTIISILQIGLIKKKVDEITLADAAVVVFA